MEITDVRVRKSEKTGNIKATASVSFDNCFVVHDLKIIDGAKGLFVVMPSKKVGDEHKDIAHPINKDFRDKISKAVLDKYNNLGE